MFWDNQYAMSAAQRTKRANMGNPLVGLKAKRETRPDRWPFLLVVVWNDVLDRHRCGHLCAFA